jgi:hypothetical protein
MSLGIVVGVLSVFIVIYRIIAVMIPMMKKGVDEKNWTIILQSLTLLV